MKFHQQFIIIILSCSNLEAIFPCSQNEYVCECSCIPENEPCRDWCFIRSQYFCNETNSCIDKNEPCNGQCRHGLEFCKNGGHPMCLASESSWNCSGECYHTNKPCDSECPSEFVLVLNHLNESICFPDVGEDLLFWYCEENFYFDFYDCNGSCQPVSKPCNQSCAGIKFRLCNDKCIEVQEKCDSDDQPCADHFTWINNECRDESTIWKCNGTNQDLRQPCNGTCPTGHRLCDSCKGDQESMVSASCIKATEVCGQECYQDRWLCEGRCYTQTQQCNGKCATSNMTLCGKNSCVMQEELFWNCDDNCINVGTTCNGQCKKGRYKCNGACIQNETPCIDRCSAGFWLCENTCISEKFECNGKCQENFWPCKTLSECIPQTSQCDGKCPDGLTPHGNLCQMINYSRKKELSVVVSMGVFTMYLFDVLNLFW